MLSALNLCVYVLHFDLSHTVQILFVGSTVNGTWNSIQTNKNPQHPAKENHLMKCVVKINL